MLIQQISNNNNNNNNNKLALVFIPGFLSKPEDFLAIFNVLDLPVTIYQFDLLSDYPSKQPIDYQAFLNSLDKLLKEIPVQQKILVGYSLGARLALGLYLKDPTAYSGLFLESLNPGIEDLIERQQRLSEDQQLALKIKNLGLEDFLKSWYQNPIFALNEAEQRKIKEEKMGCDPILTAKILEELSIGKMPSYWNDLNKINCKVELLNGEKDQKFLEITKEIQTRMPKISHIIAPNAGHNIHLQNLDFYVRELRHFVLQLC